MSHPATYYTQGILHYFHPHYSDKGGRAPSTPSAGVQMMRPHTYPTGPQEVLDVNLDMSTLETVYWATCSFPLSEWTALVISMLPHKNWGILILRPPDTFLNVWDRWRRSSFYATNVTWIHSLVGKCILRPKKQRVHLA